MTAQLHAFADRRARPPGDRPLDLICVGRVAVDLYAQQIGARLEDATSFARYLGGSSGNIAFGTARLGLRSAMLARVGDDHLGRFLRETLAQEGCDVSRLKTDPDRLTALVVLGIKDRETFPLIFYRENCADMAFEADDVDETYIASSRALLITGTHFSTAKVDAASRKALEYARRHGVRTVLDIDYRPVLWGLTGKADGENRFVASETVSAHLRRILGTFDLVIGTEEEFRIAGGAERIVDALRAVRAVTAATLVVKRGPHGCSIVEGAVPDELDDAPRFDGVRVDVLNVLGAGDAFAAGFLSGWLRDESAARCAERANACGALVVSRHGCAPAMPNQAELDHFLYTAAVDPERARRPALDAQLQRLHRAGAGRPRWPELTVFAFDHRTQLFALAQEARADASRLGRLKRLFVDAVGEVERSEGLQGRVGVLIDDRYGEDALHAATGRGWWIGRPVELPGSLPLVFEHGRSIGSALLSWPREHTVKCLVQYHPDADALTRIEQEEQIAALYQAVLASGHELLLEVIPPRDLPQGEDVVPRALKRFYNLGIQPDWWKLAPMTPAQWHTIDALIAERDPDCRGVVMLGLNAPAAALAEGFASARSSRSCRGFMVGRTIFQEPARRWLRDEIDDAGVVAEAAANFRELVDLWRGAQPDDRTIRTGVER